MRLARQNGSVKGANASRYGPCISHLLFADDIIFFGEANATRAATLKWISNEYERCSGQCVNFKKYIVFFSSNTIEADLLNLKRNFGIRSSSNLKKYLGLPNIVGRGEKVSFQHVKDRIKSRMDSWSNWVLLQGGKEIFIKSVIQVIPAYVMSCFLMPKSFCLEVESILACYWWKKGKGKKVLIGVIGVTCVSWKSWKDWGLKI